MSIQAMKMALTALKEAQKSLSNLGELLRNNMAQEELRTAIEAAEKQEPVTKCTDDDKWNCKYCNKTNTCEALQDKRNYATPQPAIPAGMVLVPVEPTQEMLDAGEMIDGDGATYVDLFKAMLAAAPKPENSHD